MMADTGTATKNGVKSKSLESSGGDSELLESSGEGSEPSEPTSGSSAIGYREISIVAGLE